MLSQSQVLAMCEEAGAFLQGHFTLTSGAHSPGYVQSSQLLGFVEQTERLAGDLAARFEPERVSCVMGLGMAGGVLAYAVARQLGTRVAYAERIQGIVSFGRGFLLAPTERVLIVADVVVTGSSVQEAMALVEQAGATVAGVGVLIDRAGGALDFGVRTESLAQVALAAYSPDDCPLCRQNLPLRRPR